MRTITITLPSGRKVTILTPIQRDLENYCQPGLTKLIKHFKPRRFSNFDFSNN